MKKLFTKAYNFSKSSFQLIFFDKRIIISIVLLSVVSYGVVYVFMNQERIHQEEKAKLQLEVDDLTKEGARRYMRSGIGGNFR